MFKLKNLATTPVLAAILLSISGAAFAQETSLSAVMQASLRALDPIQSTAHITRNHGYMIYDVLVAMDAYGRPQPQMASWTVSDDGLLYTFELREGLMFHDGAPVTADDAISSIQRWGARDGAGALALAATASLEATSETTISWTLTEPFPLLIEVLAKQSSIPAFIMPKRVAETPVDTALTDYTGSGPFIFVEDEFQPGVKVVYEKFDGYVPRDEEASGLAGGKVVYLERVEWLSMPDQQTAINALLIGEVDYLENTQIDLLPILEGSPDIVTETRDPVGMQGYARMNFKHPPFDNVTLRQAAMAAISQDDVMMTMIGDADRYWTCGAVFGCNTPLGSETGAETLLAGGDIELARNLLEDGGYDGAPVVILQSTDSGMYGTVSVVIAAALRDAGFVVDLQAMDWQTLVGRRANMGPTSEGGWSLFTTFANGVEANTPLVHPILPSTGDSGWFGWADDPELEELRAKYVVAETFEEQQEIAYAVQARVMENVIAVPLGSYAAVQARRDTLVDMLPTSVPVFWNMRFTE